MQVIVKNIICIFTIKNGEVYVVLDGDKIPCIICDNNIDTINKNYLKTFNINKLNLKQTYTFSENKDDILTFYILFNSIVSYNDVQDLNLIAVNEIKDDEFISKGLEYLKENIIVNKNLEKILSNEFALPELQKLLENVLGKSFDRRNFRKKLISQNIIEPVDKINNSDFGRPAKLYKFKNIEERKII